MNTVLAPSPMVIVPGRNPMPLFPPPRRSLAAPEPAPHLRPVQAAESRPAPPQRWRMAFEEPQVSVPGREAPMPLTTTPPPTPPPIIYGPTNFATSVALVPAGGTNVTSTPANLMIGPITYIADFTINSLDAGTF
jgi:hypothetical protein